MTRDLLRAVGEALYGPRWQRELAAALGVHERTMRRWVADQTRPPDGVIDDLRALLRARRRLLAETLRALPLSRAASPPRS